MSFEYYTTQQPSYTMSEGARGLSASHWSGMFRVDFGSDVTTPRHTTLSVSEEAERFIQSHRLAVRDVIERIRELALSAGAASVDVDLFVDYDEVDEEGRPWEVLSITVCVPGLSASEEVDTAIRLDEELGRTFPDLPAYFAVECPGE
ncbi:MAG: hypothetical protein RXQ62_06645 [Nitrososphaeria archaeon]